MFPAASEAQRSYGDDDYAIQTGRFDEALERKSPGWIFNKPSAANAEAQMKLAQDLEKQGKLRAAGKAYNALVHKWHEAPEAVKAQQSFARVLHARGKHEDAFDEYQYLIEYFQGKFKYTEALEIQFQLANQVMTMKHWNVLFMPGFKDPMRAIPMFEKIIANGPGWPKTTEAQFYIGLINEDEEQYDAAIAAYETLINRYPNSQYAAEAAYRWSKCLCQKIKRTKYDEGSYRTALSALASFRRDYPEHPGNAEAGREIERLFGELAKLYYDKADYYDHKAKKPGAAIIAYKDFLKQFPKSELAEQAEKRIEELTTLKEKSDEKKAD